MAELERDLLEEQEDVCPACGHVHDHVDIDKLKECPLFDRVPEEEELDDLADLFKVFSDSTRIRILFDLMHGEVSVTDISEHLGMTQSAISHQLRTLKQSKLVKNRRDGKTIYYSLADDHVQYILAMGRDHIEED